MNKKIEILVSNETLEQMNKIICNLKFLNLAYEEDTELNHEELLKSALDYYIKHIDNLTYFRSVHNGEFKILKNKIKDYIRKFGITQSELSNATGIDKANLSHILNNRNQPTTILTLRIWIALGKPSIEELFYWE